MGIIFFRRLRLTGAEPLRPFGSTSTWPVIPGCSWRDSTCTTSFTSTSSGRPTFSPTSSWDGVRVRLSRWLHILFGSVGHSFFRIAPGGHFRLGSGQVAFGQLWVSRGGFRFLLELICIFIVGFPQLLDCLPLYPLHVGSARPHKRPVHCKGMRRSGLSQFR